MALSLGFGERESEEIALVVKELATNLLKHAKSGTLTLTPLTNGEHNGIRIESVDKGPGIPDIERALADGFSTTTGSLGYGLGTANRLMSQLEIKSGPKEGTHITCYRYLHKDAPNTIPCPFSFGTATRPHPRMDMNGDAFIIKKWSNSALVGVIDGLGHGQWAHRASQAARNYIESHYDQPLIDIFRGVGRACRPTRGVVMALALFDWERGSLSFASIGNIETRIFNSVEPSNLLIRRGVIGMNAPKPVVTELQWNLSQTLVMHSDGLKTHWRAEDFPGLFQESATIAAQRLLQALSKDNDDATVVVIKGK